jgi:hypothetical protein
LLQLLILCDAGGVNGHRSRLWKYASYKKICCRYNIATTVCHYPSDASKWNPIDHRLFSSITINWAGVPLRSYDIMLNCIRQTTTEKGLRVDAVTNDQIKDVTLENYDHLLQWNYTIYPNQNCGIRNLYFLLYQLVKQIFRFAKNSTFLSMDLIL